MIKIKIKLLLFLLITFTTLLNSKSNKALYREVWEKSNIFNYSHSYTKNIEQIAFHEAGHALISKLLNLKIEKATIIPKKGNSEKHDSAGGVLVSIPCHNKTLKVKVFLAGYAAEEIIYGKAAYGICNDLDNATETALKIASTSNKSVFQILEEELNEVKSMLTANIFSLQALTEKLLEEKTLPGWKINQIVNFTNSFVMQPSY